MQMAFELSGGKKMADVREVSGKRGNRPTVNHNPYLAQYNGKTYAEVRLRAGESAEAGLERILARYKARPSAKGQTISMKGASSPFAVRIEIFPPDAQKLFAALKNIGETIFGRSSSADLASKKGILGPSTKE
ncbi:hypothetical protein A3D23_07610 [candidate division WOR-1 bacterium RIFCSPHIGHO2_02_FULL_53_26]|nr:MAG: hypothetical protein A3D23_07610 [candidate division WOR-1 bacterium RIFCSPHIGHO2_02_FULL_53_26]